MSVNPGTPLAGASLAASHPNLSLTTTPATGSTTNLATPTMPMTAEERIKQLQMASGISGSNLSLAPLAKQEEDSEPSEIRDKDRTMTHEDDEVEGDDDDKESRSSRDVKVASQNPCSTPLLVPPGAAGGSKFHLPASGHIDKVSVDFSESAVELSCLSNNIAFYL